MKVLGGPGVKAGFIPLRGGGRRPPLFVIQDWHSVDEAFAVLTERGKAGFPIFCLFDKAADASEPRTVEGQATRILETIRAIQPHGPYRLAAWPDCALVAYEIGTQLVGHDQEVGFIGLVGDMVHVNVRDYQPAPAAALPIHLFVGKGASSAESGLMPWRELLPTSQVRIVRLTQCERPEMRPDRVNARALARALTQAVTAASGQVSTKNLSQ